MHGGTQRRGSSGWHENLEMMLLQLRRNEPWCMLASDKPHFE
jgi:hypothetical protein